MRRRVELTQYASEHFQRLLAEQGITCSMSRAGEVWGNSAMEGFFSSLKTERTAREVYRSREDAGQTCSTTSNASTTRRAGTRHWDISARCSSRKREKLRSVSTESAAAQTELAMRHRGEQWLRAVHYITTLTTQSVRRVCNQHLRPTLSSCPISGLADGVHC